MGHCGASVEDIRVLVFTPTYGDGPRPETLASIAALGFTGAWHHEVSWHNPYGDGNMANVLAQYLRGSQLALDGGYDALLTVEHDMQVPPSALQALWDAGAPVAYGVYVFRQGLGKTLNALEFLPNARNIGESLGLHYKKLMAARQREIVPVSGVGFGCTLIRREVLERVPFRADENGVTAPDVPFAIDCLRAGVAQVAHFGVACGHWNGTEWLYPFGSGCTVRVVALQNVTVNIEYESQRLILGQEYELPGSDAHDLARAGYVRTL